MTKGHKIATFIDNMVKKLANIYKLRSEQTKCIVKLLISIYSYNKYCLLDRLKLLRDEKNVPIFHSFTGKVKKD